MYIHVITARAAPRQSYVTSAILMENVHVVYRVPQSCKIDSDQVTVIVIDCFGMLPVRSQLQGSFRMPTLPTFSVRFDEQQLVDLAAKARVQGTKRGYLHKSDSKLKKLSQRWCCVFSNLLFYFESESCTRPLGVVYLEGCTCLPMDQIGLPGRELEVRKLAGPAQRR